MLRWSTSTTSTLLALNVWSALQSTPPSLAYTPTAQLRGSSAMQVTRTTMRLSPKVLHSSGHKLGLIKREAKSIRYLAYRRWTTFGFVDDQVDYRLPCLHQYHTDTIYLLHYFDFTFSIRSNKNFHPSLWPLSFERRTFDFVSPRSSNNEGGSCRRPSNHTYEMDCK